MSALLARFGLRRLVADESGQMTVELATVLPVVVILGLIALNLMRFVGACSQFDRLALNAVISQGVSPAGEQGGDASTEQVGEAIRLAMGGDSYTVSVRTERVALVGVDGSPFSISSNLTRYVCTLRMRTWPSGVAIAGVSLGAPLALEHEREFVVDRFRPGVVM